MDLLLIYSYEDLFQGFNISQLNPGSSHDQCYQVFSHYLHHFIRYSIRSLRLDAGIYSIINIIHYNKPAAGCKGDLG